MRACVRVCVRACVRECVGSRGGWARGEALGAAPPCLGQLGACETLAVGGGAGRGAVNPFLPDLKLVAPRQSAGASPVLRDRP